MGVDGPRRPRRIAAARFVRPVAHAAVVLWLLAGVAWPEERVLCRQCVAQRVSRAGIVPRVRELVVTSAVTVNTDVFPGATVNWRKVQFCGRVQLGISRPVVLAWRLDRGGPVYPGRRCRDFVLYGLECREPAE